MRDFFGILLLDHTDILLRIYEIDDKRWRLLHSLNRDVQEADSDKAPTATTITTVITEFLTLKPTQHVAQWHIGSRGIPQETIQAVSEATGLPIEILLFPREQELLCKGMFTELW